MRQIPPGDPDFETMYRRCNDAASIKEHLDDPRLWDQREVLLWLVAEVCGRVRADSERVSGIGRSLRIRESCALPVAARVAEGWVIPCSAAGGRVVGPY